jgi:hypothetical protein
MSHYRFQMLSQTVYQQSVVVNIRVVRIIELKPTDDCMTSVVTQVVEIAELTKHCLDECEKKTTVSRCPRCSEAILKTDLKNHTSSKSCPRKYFTCVTRMKSGGLIARS